MIKHEQPADLPLILTQPLILAFNITLKLTLALNIWHLRSQLI